MRRRKHRKDYPRNAKRCPFCGSRVQRTAPHRWDCLGCPTFWPMVDSNPGPAQRVVSVGWEERYEPVGRLPVAHVDGASVRYDNAVMPQVMEVR